MRRYAAHDRLGTYFVHAMQMSARDIARKHAGIVKKSNSTADKSGDVMLIQVCALFSLQLYSWYFFFVRVCVCVCVCVCDVMMLRGCSNFIVVWWSALQCIMILFFNRSVFLSIYTHP